MKWTIFQIPKHNIINVETTGTMSVESLNQMVTEALMAAERHNFEHFLVDHRKVHIAMGVAETYDRPKELDGIGVTRNSRIAHVYDKKDLKNFRFLETVSVNRGYQVRVFQDITLAEEWLIS